MRIALASLLFALLSGCVTPVVVATPPDRPVSRAAPARPAPSVAARNFVAVVERVMPHARAACREQARRARCDYAVVVDDRSGVPANAFQTLAPDGRPIVGFTLPLILEARNPDELAFILSHEAAHHIAGHIGRGQTSARTTATLAGALVALGGGNDVAIRQAQDFGAFYGARRYAKEFELEADALGAILARRAGYDPLVGIMYFQNAPDPGNRFLGTHPPNADRIATVRRVLAGR